MRSAARGGKTAVLVAVCFGLFMVQLDLTIVNLALSSLREDLGARVTELQWIIDAYAVFFSSLMLTAGDLGDRWGLKRVYLAGLLLFLLASAACALAPDAAFLIGARAVQGVGAAALLPNSLAILRHTFSDPRERARAIGWWAGISGLSLIAGPTLGGLLLGGWGWRAVFWINVPLGLVALWLTWRVVEASAAERARPPDWRGQALSILVLGAAVFALIEGRNLGWGSPVILAAFALALGGAVLFYRVERRQAAPMVDLACFRSPGFTAANAAAGLMNFGMFGMIFAFSLFLLSVRHLSPASAGLHLLALFAPFALLVPLGGRLAGRLGYRYPTALGLGLSALGLALLSGVQAESSGLRSGLELVLIGVGLAAATPAIVAAALGAVPAARAGMASAVNNTSRQAGGALGVALLGGFLAARGTLLAGVHWALAGAALALLAGALIGWGFIREPPAWQP